MISFYFSFNESDKLIFFNFKHLLIRFDNYTVAFYRTLLSDKSKDVKFLQFNINSTNNL